MGGTLSGGHGQLRMQASARSRMRARIWAGSSSMMLRISKLTSQLSGTMLSALPPSMVVLRKNSNPLDLSWWRDYWPAVASSQRDRSASYRPSVAGRPGRADRALGQTPASHRSRAFGPASSAGALQGAGHETPAHRCRDARKLGLAVAVLRLALLPGDHPSGNRAAVAPSRLATILALQVATGASADFSRPAATHMAHGQGESAMGRGKHCNRVVAEAWFAGLAAYRAQVHPGVTARSRTR